MMKFASFLVLFSCVFALRAGDASGFPVTDEDGVKAIRFDFQRTKLDGDGRPDGWTYKGKFRTPDVRYAIVEDPELKHRVLLINAPQATGVVMADISDIDLAKYPIMRWRWKAVQLPTGADARVKAKDDQGIAVYVGYGRFKQTSLSYTWETETPKGETGEANYNGFVTVYWRAMRNKNDPMNVWQTDQVDLYQDILDKFGKVPDNLALSISSNSQYTESHAEVMIDYIEFRQKK